MLMVVLPTKLPLGVRAHLPPSLGGCCTAACARHSRTTVRTGQTREVGSLLRLLLLLQRRVAGVPSLDVSCRCMDVPTGRGPEQHTRRCLPLMCRPAPIDLPGCRGIGCQSLLLLLRLVATLLLLRLLFG